MSSAKQIIDDESDGRKSNSAQSTVQSNSRYRSSEFWNEGRQTSSRFADLDAQSRSDKAQSHSDLSSERDPDFWLRRDDDISKTDPDDDLGDDTSPETQTIEPKSDGQPVKELIARHKSAFVATGALVLIAGVAVGIGYGYPGLSRASTQLFSKVNETEMPKAANSGASPASAVDVSRPAVPVSGAAVAPNTDPQTLSGAVPAQPTPQLQGNPVSQLAQGLFKLGALSCLARANQIANFLSIGSEAVVLQKPSGDPDKSLLMSTLVPTAASKTRDLALISMAPNQSAGCEGNYQAVHIDDKPCPAALSELYRSYQPTPIGDAGIVMVSLTQTARAFAIPAGNSCVLIKQELVK